MRHVQPRSVCFGWKADVSRDSKAAVVIFTVLCVLGGLWNTFFAARALGRGFDTMFGQRFDRERDPAAFWFYSIFCRGGSALLLLSFPLLVSRW